MASAFYFKIIFYLISFECAEVSCIYHGVLLETRGVYFFFPFLQESVIYFRHVGLWGQTQLLMFAGKLSVLAEPFCQPSTYLVLFRKLISQYFLLAYIVYFNELKLIPFQIHQF